MPSIKNNKTVKILLINPPGEFKTPVLPLGLASIAAYLKNADIQTDISVIDLWAENLNSEELKNKVKASEADIVGIYIVSPNYKKAKKTIEICRQALPNALFVAGGPHPSAVPEETLKDISQLDVCCIGEGEITVYELVKGNPLPDINGIAYRANNEIILTKPREFIKNLDELPFPYRDLFPLKKYRTHPPFGRKNPYFTMITARGCPYQCVYCSKDVYSDNYRSRSPEKVCQEIEHLISKYGAKEIHFYDDDFTLNMARAEKICDEIIKRGIKLRWSCLTRVNLINENLLRKMKNAGCWLIAYGVESGNQEILNSINKGITVPQIVSAFKATRELGISTICYYMMGLPGDTKETIKETLELVKKLKPSFISCGILIVYPGSRLFKLISQGKYQGKLRILREGESLAGTYFGKGNYMVLEDNLTFEELKELVQENKKEFYLRPRYLFQCLKDIKSFSDFHYYLSGGLEMIKSFLR